MNAIPLREILELIKAGLTPEEVLYLEGWQECDARHTPTWE